MTSYSRYHHFTPWKKGLQPKSGGGKTGKKFTEFCMDGLDKDGKSQYNLKLFKRE